jgi:hypothetical protein
MSVVLSCLAGLLAAGPAGDGVFTVPSRTFQIPLRVEEGRRAELQEVLLFVSTDSGRSWETAGRVGPDRDSVAFTAPRDGVYWFTVAAVGRDGKQSPADLTGASPMLKVCVETAGKDAPEAAPPADLEQEAARLRAAVEQMEKRVAELEARKALREEVERLRSRLEALQRRVDELERGEKAPPPAPAWDPARPNFFH